MLSSWASNRGWVAGASLSLLLYVSTSSAASSAALRTWTGAGPNAFWSTAANWNPSGAPQNGEDLAFPANGPQRTNNNDLPARTFGFILFNGGKSDYDLHGNGITAYPDYRLQSVNFLDGPGPYPFNNVANSPGLVSGKFLVTNAVAGPRQFFRLSK